MAKYRLQHDEAVLRVIDGVKSDSGVFSSYTDELVLTSLHLIVVRKGTFKNVKNIEYLPLALLKVHNGRAQALMSKNVGSFYDLELFFQNGERTFQFPKGKREVSQWVEAINRAVTGNEVTQDKPAATGLATVGLLAETVRDTFGQLRAPRGGGDVTGAAPPPPPVDAGAPQECPGCGAPLSRESGSLSTCAYCDREYRIP